ncbi:NADP-dependent 3-hydroxy acid dehydrogenase YdfG [Hymenobacter luteus]|uniref:NADP-dependent 3-hydroxy acid dehydrogenase YdfG n=2 Tax=Hymenobacter TaxID=89966 RepID=A0A7W9SZT0_9BACT|nr:MULTISPECIES: SDR family NAD(P)-dependent oxidoreductase [Hymenobacter]MBB4601310.1 NADP-dependent 3-hydroxy acid dehydrogenase YdfG [Hymenobacter latericoloratus]MBB6058483.1 NADP-dependent 3-hydroxy acid dehydrogenase YdfG [Hymenobacter luteus]
MDLSGKVAIITGVSKGIGLATAEALLARGAVVAGWGRTAPQGLQHERFQFFECDIRNEIAVQEAYMNTQRELGQEIHVLVNNAGIGNFGPVDGFSSDDWHAMFDTNVHGLFYCTKAVLPQMKKQREGHVINVASLAGTAGTANLAGYCATKYAVRGFSDALFKEVRPDGVRVTCLMPGSVETNFNGATPGQEPNPHKMQPQDVAAAIIHALEAPQTVMISELQMRPTQPK